MIKAINESDMFTGLSLVIVGTLLLLYAIKTRKKYKLFSADSMTIHEFGLSILLIIIGTYYLCLALGLI